MFRRTAPVTAPVAFSFEQRTLIAQAGDSIALALLAAGIAVCRDSVVSAQPRAPYCLMGACFECLVDVDGVANVQGCQVQVREGMRVARQAGRCSVDRLERQ